MLSQAATTALDRNDRSLARGLATGFKVVALPVLLAWWFAAAAGWQQMLAVALGLLGSLKWLSLRLAGTSATAGSARHWGYLLLWPGLDARGFHDVRLRPARPAAAEWLLAGGNLALGVLLAWGLARQLVDVAPLWAAWIGFTGLVLVIHFGVCHLLSLSWRSAGVMAEPIMDWPIAARSLGEFWGRRWNRAFRQVVFDAVYRPLLRTIGSRSAMLLVFVVSAVVHELAISLPAGAGYGLPSVYFLLQAAGVLAERSPWGAALGLRHGWRGRAFTLLVVLAPVMLLFPRPFMLGVVLPLLSAWHAI